MRRHLEDMQRLCGIDEALEAVTKRHPPLADIATSCALLLKARKQASEALPTTSLLGPQPDASALAERLAEGVPLLGPVMDSMDAAGPELVDRLRQAARIVLPAAAQAFPVLAPELAKIAVRLDAADGGGQLAARMLAAIAPGAGEATVETLAEELGLEPPALFIAATESLMAVLAAEAVLLANTMDLQAWRQPYCPVCGGGADASILKEGSEDSEFLIAKAGQLWKHCGQCAALWRFPRMCCAACGTEDPEQLELLTLDDGLGSEHMRAQLCKVCNTYATMVNMVDRTDRLNLEFLHMMLLPLELLAQKRGFRPQTPSPWNSLG